MMWLLMSIFLISLLTFTCLSSTSWLTIWLSMEALTVLYIPYMAGSPTANEALQWCCDNGLTWG